MKHLFLTIFTLSFLFIGSSNAQLLATFTTTTKGGTVGQITDFTPQVAFYQKGTSRFDETILFEDFKITSNNETTSLILQKGGEDGQFEAFCTLLTSGENPLLQVGHCAGNVKNMHGRYLADWFGGLDKLMNQNITAVQVTFSKVVMQTPGSNLTNDGNWTDFQYEVTLSVYGGAGFWAEVK